MDGFYLSYEVITVMGDLHGNVYVPLSEEGSQINNIFAEILKNQRSWIARNTLPSHPIFKVRLFYADQAFNRLWLLESKRFNCELTFNEIPKTPLKVDFNGETK